MTEIGAAGSAALPAEINSIHSVAGLPKISRVDVRSLAALLADFSTVCAVPTAVLDRDGKVLHGARWQRACTDFHRAAAASCANCQESDVFLASRLREGEFVDYKCRNGLWDVVTPLFMGGRHVGNLYCGQFFYDDDVIDETFFAAQGERFGYDRADYLAAIRAVPRFSREHIRGVMSFIVRLAAYLSQVSIVDADLSESKARMQALIEAVPDMVWLKDTAGVYLSCNPAFERFFGAREAQILGRTDYDFVPRDEADSFRRGDAAAIAAGGPVVNEEWVTLADGGQRVLLETIKTPILDAAGQPLGVLGVARDITQRKAAEAELRQAKNDAERANEAKSRFLAAASHDLRQPLTALGIYVGALAGHVAPGGRALLANLEECVGSLSRLLTDLLDFSKLEAGVVTPKKSDFALADTLTCLAAAYAPEAQLKGLRLRCRASGAIAHTDRVLFQRILGNFVDNAVRYTEQGGVLIACRRRRGKTWIEVWDTGIGIPAGKTAEIFEEFRQLGDDARTRGSGLGLAIAARTAAVLGLEIRVGSRPGRGSLFAVELPCKAAAVLPPPAAAQAVRRAWRIAFVEDNRLVRDALAFVLRANGHDVVAAASGADLLAALAGAPPDIVVSDYRLGGGETGFDVITRTRASAGRELPAILITGDTDPKLLRSMTGRGIVVIHKPLDGETLETCIEKLTRQDDSAALRGA